MQIMIDARSKKETTNYDYGKNYVADKWNNNKFLRGDYAHFLPKQDNSFGTYSCFRKKNIKNKLSLYLFYIQNFLPIKILGFADRL